MSFSTVKQLREIAKEIGLSGFWKLRKAELINLIQQHSPRGIVNFIEQPLAVALPKVALRTPIPPPPINSLPRYQLKKKMSRREKRENKNNEGYWKVLLQSETHEKRMKERQAKRLKKKIHSLNRKVTRVTRD